MSKAKPNPPFLPEDHEILLHLLKPNNVIRVKEKYIPNLAQFLKNHPEYGRHFELWDRSAALAWVKNVPNGYLNPIRVLDSLRRSDFRLWNERKYPSEIDLNCNDIVMLTEIERSSLMFHKSLFSVIPFTIRCTPVEFTL